jgi:biotin transport system substrate-specific component
VVTHLPFGQTALASLVFVPGDLVKAIIATAVVNTLVRAYPRAFRREWTRAAPTEQHTPQSLGSR